MIDYSTPIYSDSRFGREMEERRVWQHCIGDGRASRRAGVPLEYGDNFVDKDMTASWRMGWEQQDIIERNKGRG